ncbi:MAG: hypothetical protein GIKADHBN_03087 [Phycisphaerales bacterium]|nr:hypothetical protein [Phycisphaerales bacterium]
MPDPVTSTPRARSWTGTLVQVVGLCVGLGLLAWCVSMALKPENRDQLRHLADARPSAIAGLLALSFASLLANGGVFWSLIRPIRTLDDRRGVPFWRMQAANAVATCLAYVPFKLSILFRVLVHRTQDRIPVGTIAAWIAAAAASLVVVCGPVLGLALIGFARERLLIAAGASALAAATLGWWLARLFAGPGGLAAIRRGADVLWPGVLGRLSRSAMVQHLHAGFDIAGTAQAWFGAVAFRALDLFVQALRFWTAAHILGLEIDLGSAILLGAVYYTLGAASPSGALGVREGGATLVAKLMQLSGGDTHASVTLLVTASDAVPTVLSAIAGALYIRPWRLRRT